MIRGKKKELSTINIRLDANTTLSSDAYSWVLIHKGRYTYHPSLDLVFSQIFEDKVRGSKATTLQDLADAIIASKVEILDMLKPFSTWNDQGIHFLLREDFEHSTRVVSSAVEETNRVGCTPPLS